VARRDVHLPVPAAGTQRVAVVEEDETVLGDRVGEVAHALVEQAEGVAHAVGDAEAADHLDHARPVARAHELGTLGPAAHHGCVRNPCQPPGSAEVVGVAVGDEHLVDVG